MSDMFPEIQKEEWSAIKRRIFKKIFDGMGQKCVEEDFESVKWRELDRYIECGLEHVKIKYTVIGEYENEAVYILPRYKELSSVPCVIAVHGCNSVQGKCEVLLKKNENTCYALELAKRGYLVIAADQFGFGSWTERISQEKLFADFYEKHPDWSIDGIRLLVQVRVADILDTLEMTEKNKYSVLGHSLGGRTALFFLAFDERVKTGSISAGVSPNKTNVYRQLNPKRKYNPNLKKAVSKNGRVPWDYHELMSICAPKALLMLDAFNDPFNPYIAENMGCFNEAAAIYGLLDASEKFSMYIHGDGHKTFKNTRQIMYNWIDRFAER
jgi:dienelactone hydrolase